MTTGDLAPVDEVAGTEMDAAALVASGAADAALGIAAMAQGFRLGFRAIVDENFDLLIDRRAYFSAPWQALWRFARSPQLAEKAASLGGYDLRSLGLVRWVSP